MTVPEITDRDHEMRRDAEMTARGEEIAELVTDGAEGEPRTERAAAPVAQIAAAAGARRARREAESARGRIEGARRAAEAAQTELLQIVGEQRDDAAASRFAGLLTSVGECVRQTRLALARYDVDAAMGGRA